MMVIAQDYSCSAYLTLAHMAYEWSPYAWITISLYSISSAQSTVLTDVVSVQKLRCLARLYFIGNWFALQDEILDARSIVGLGCVVRMR
jgi:hypothetical protein